MAAKTAQFHYPTNSARNKLAQTGNLTYFEYPGMAHGICNQEIHDLRAWLGL